MRVSPVRTVAELVRAKLQDYTQEHSALGSMTVERAYKARVPISQANAENGVLCVYGASQTGTRRTREHTQREIVIDIELIKLVNEDPMSQKGKTELDRLVDLMEDILISATEINVEADGQTTRVRNVNFLRMENDPWYDEAALVNDSLFVSRPTLTYAALVDS